MNEAVSEIISSCPGFVIRNGIAIFSFILLICLLACRFISYPDVVNAHARLTSVNAPKEIKAKTSGRLAEIFVKENDSVYAGEITGYMESLADPHAVISLSAKLDAAGRFFNADSTLILSDRFSSFAITGLFRNKENTLGELQPDYETFVQAYQTFADYADKGFYKRKRIMLYSDLENIHRMNKNIFEQLDLQQQDLDLTQKNFAANDTLKKQKVISDLDYRTEQSKLLNKKLSIPQLHASLLSNEAQQNDKMKELLQLENEFERQKQIFIQAFKTFQSKTNEWKKNYLLIAPVSGRISFASLIEKNQQMETGQTICFVNQKNTQLYAVLYLSQYNMGRVKTGQTVLLKFASYPYPEFGSVEGKIDFISRIPADSAFLAKVILPADLKTNFNKHIQYRNGLMAECNIITEKVNLLQKVLQGFTGYLPR